MKKKLVYIAGKLNDKTAVDYINNVNLMLTIGEMFRRNGFLVYTPCNLQMNGIFSGEWDYKDYAETNMRMLESCDALYVIDNWVTSKGTKAEIKRAKELNIPIFYNGTELQEWGDNEAK